MLSAVLRSERAIMVSIEIMNAFVQMRHYLRHNMGLVGRLNAFESKVDTKLVEHDLKFKKIDENFSKIFGLSVIWRPKIVSIPYGYWL